MPAHKWTFKLRFRTNAYGWKGTALASKRLKEAVSEIKKVAKSEPVTAADGAIGLMERLWPALQGIDGSSGSLGGAVNRTLDTLIPVIIAAPADIKTRSKWLERLYDAVEEDGVDYLWPVKDQWGALCDNAEVANYWADRLLPLVRETWASEQVGAWAKGATICLSSLVTAKRYQELRELLSLRSFRFWPEDQFWARALVQQGQIDEAITFAESLRKDRPSYGDAAIVEFCEQTLLATGRTGEAYDRFALQVTRATTNLSTFRQINKKYPDRQPRQILLDLIGHHGSQGKWFAAAKDAGCLDVALECAGDCSAEPATLIRAARDFVEKDAEFAAQVALCAIAHLLAGGGYEPTARDLMQAHQYLTEAAAKWGRSKWASSEVDRLISQGAVSDRQDFLQLLVAERGQQVDR